MSGRTKKVSKHLVAEVAEIWSSTISSPKISGGKKRGEELYSQDAEMEIPFFSYNTFRAKPAKSVGIVFSIFFISLTLFLV